ncbi:MAG: M67 family metallopeptidase [bacterium]
MKTERAILAAEHLAAVAQEAELAFPAECCGLLLGRRTPQGWSLEQSRAMRNASPQPERGFEFDTHEQLRAYREADAAGLEVLGNYHSHPNARRGPSPVDLALARERCDRSLWLILAVANGKFDETSLWQLQGEPGEFERIEYSIVS